MKNLNAALPGSRRRFLSAWGALCAAAAAGSATAATLTRRSGAPFRRVVTGLDGDGRSTIVSDGPVPTVAQWKHTPEEIKRFPFVDGIEGNEVWIFDHLPSDARDTSDPLLGNLPHNDRPPAGGAIARVHRFAPGVVFPMHATPTVDLHIIISGKMSLDLEADSAVLGAGDIVVQRQTRHSWRVVGNEPCVFVAVMVDAAPPKTA